MPFEQISVNLGAEPLALSQLTSLCYREAVQLEAISVSRDQNGLVCRLVVQDGEKLPSLLSSNNISYETKKVLVVEVPDHPGGLHAILKILDKNAVQINQVYPAASAFNSGERLILDVADGEEAEKLLTENWIDLGA